jgi:hypothetical protein
LPPWLLRLQIGLHLTRRRDPRFLISSILIRCTAGFYLLLYGMPIACRPDTLYV